MSRWLATVRPDVDRFWTGAGASAESAVPAVIDLVDGLYALRLIGAMDRIAADAPDRFAAALRAKGLAAGLSAAEAGQAAAEPLGVHTTAYALGALTLLAAAGHDRFDAVLAPEGTWRLDTLIDPASRRPRFPKKWAHHTWRVSHWVGGAPSILLSLERARPERARGAGAPPVIDVLAAADALIDAETGLLRCWNSRLVQAAFRAAYRLRHDPAAGDIGGIVHLHWVNHATGRAYKAGDRLRQRAEALMLDNEPFMEAVPYCLDFDVVQIVRTGRPDGTFPRPIADRAARYGREVAGFLGERAGDGYTLHKLPGALATVHEAARITGAATVDGLGLAPIDIIAEAHWL
ncbi:MAG: hypothetical protein GVY28_10730 [Alphaproteobacteria bacterium]|nr:hypothetical protein [Alphaproteobacteria bacterium]